MGLTPITGLATTGIVLLPAQVASAASTLTVTNCDDSGIGSLRDAVSSATSGDTITFAYEGEGNLIGEDANLKGLVSHLLAESGSAE
jgi:hypothetical protein